MTEEDIRKRAFAMPQTSPIYPPGPYRFVGHEYLIITYRTDPERLRPIVPEPRRHSRRNLWKFGAELFIELFRRTAVSTRRQA